MLIVKRSAWCEKAESDLMPAAFGDMEWIREEVQRGISDLWRIEGVSVGWLVTRLEDGELVLVAGAGKNSVPLLRHVTDKARAAGLTIRTHIRRPGLRRIYERLGYRFSEMIMRA